MSSSLLSEIVVDFHPHQSPPGFVQWFRDNMDKQGVNLQSPPGLVQWFRDDMDKQWVNLQSPPGLVQWFRDDMDKQGVNMQIFIDPETDVELVFILPTATIW
jgi:hypothetical protein